ncbi:MULTISPECIES: hypothetical protein [Glutamicibacter]|uniref:Helicase n=1 Tax=Glutamicibacter halophytocola TaxID=1933880 RepID=A0A5B8IRM1_9MICC|nr:MULTISPECIES: hypothetical protein [Glutamicibacter]MBF6671319.1 hypothetical protein [Glutamicibacter sp. FBE19]QDY67581.1 hypothetical protein FQA45_15420 [Glutamicibacter halophytocola]UUX59763.1 hypothetical protein NUH22_03835 [Glutamicibacter halophytocola]
MEFGTRQVTLGGLERAHLQQRMAEAGVQLNDYAKVLLAHEIFERIAPVRMLNLVSRTVQQLGLDAGATLPEIFDRAISSGLGLCPAITGPYLRLEFLDQAASRDSLTISSAALGDEGFPRGFYLRVVEGAVWLRGYRCDDTHGFALADTFVFQDR